MRRIFIIILCSIWAVEAYPFWIWSPKNQKWKNPEYAPLATPALQSERAISKFDQKRYKAALKEFKKVLIHFPDAEEAADSQYYLGRCWEELKQPYRAYEEYQKVIDSYPNSKRIQEIIERQYTIGEYFLNKEPKKWLGISLFELAEHPSMGIFKKVVENAPYSEYAPCAQYKLGILYAKLGRFQEAKDAFQALLDNYPDSEWAEAGKYQLAMASAKASYGIDYDDVHRKEALSGFSDFLKRHPDTQLTQEAETQFQELREKEAKKNYTIAQFYEKQKKIESAIVYYEVVITTYPHTRYAQPAKERLEKLKK